jgi:hypothetical protein
MISAPLKGPFKIANLLGQNRARREGKTTTGARHLEPAIVRRRGHEPDLVVYRLSARLVVQPEPCIALVREVRLIAYGRVRRVLSTH